MSHQNYGELHRGFLARHLARNATRVADTTRKSNLRVPLAMLLGMFAAAYNLMADVQVSGAGVCAKPDPSYSITATDSPGHVFLMGLYQCIWTKPIEIAGTKTKGGPDIISVELHGTTADWSEFYVDTADTGDKGYYRFRGTATFKDGIMQDLTGKWTLVGGTGKLNGVKGSGTCTGKGEQSGAVTFDCKGKSKAPK